jgi:hypothetical protein
MKRWMTVFGVVGLAVSTLLGGCSSSAENGSDGDETEEKKPKKDKNKEDDKDPPKKDDKDPPKDPPASGPKVGDQCTATADCQKGGLCVFKGDAQIGFCSKRCESFSECPTFWECEAVGNTSATYCVPSD